MTDGGFTMVRLPETALVQWGISRDFALKEVKMNELLSQWPLLCSEARVPYALFGGTALNKAYLDQPRFSEDADFFVYGRTLKDVDRLARNLSGFQVKGPKRIFRDLYRWTLAYDAPDSGGLRGEIQLDVNLHFKKPASVAIRLPLKSFLSDLGVLLIPPRLDVLPKVTLLGMKLLALQNREEGKDFYDVFRLLSADSFSRTAVLGEARKYSDSLFDFYRSDPQIIEHATDSVKDADVARLAQTDAYILKAQRPDWGALKKDVVRLLKTKIS